MDDQLMAVGPLEVLVPHFATQVSVEKNGALTSLVANLGPVTLTLWHADGGLDERQAFLQKLLAAMKPRRHERKAITLGGAEFDAVEMFDCERTFAKYTAAVGDVFGDLVCVAWGYSQNVADVSSIEFLINTMMEGVIVRRPRTLPPGALKAWMEKKDAERAASKR